MRKVQRITDYRGYRLILYLPVIESKHICHLGYIGDDFFGYRLKRSSTVNAMTPLQVIDHYLDTFYFKSPEMDYAIFGNDNKYKLEMACLKFIHDQRT